MSRLIDADELIDFIMSEDNGDKLMNDWYADMVARMPTVQHETERNGIWIPYSERRHNPVYKGLFMCSVCMLWVGRCTNYCSFCGTKMDQEAADDAKVD